MINNEYFTTREISVKTKQSTRNVRRIIQKLEGNIAKELLHMDNNQWKIHKLILGKFKPQRIIKNKYYALSFDPCANYTESEINEVMKFVFDKMNDNSLEINYTIERKKSNNQNHLHCFVSCSEKKKLLDLIKLGFSRISYHETKIFDLEGWRNYITKDNNKIIKLIK